MPDKNNQNIHSAAPPVPVSIVNNQSSISQIRRQLGGINREIPYSPDPHSRNKAKSKRSADPPVAEFPDPLLSPVLCLLSPVFYPYPLSNPPCLLYSSVFFLFRANSCHFVVHSCLGVPARGPLGLRGMTQLCKTNPILKTRKSTQPPVRQRFTRIIRPAESEKTNPNKPNLVAAKPLAKPERTQSYAPAQSSILHPESSILPILPKNHGRIMQNKPNSSKQKNHRNPRNCKALQTKSHPHPKQKTNPIKPNLSRSRAIGSLTGIPLLATVSCLLLSCPPYWAGFSIAYSLCIVATYSTPLAATGVEAVALSNLISLMSFFSLLASKMKNSPRLVPIYTLPSATRVEAHISPLASCVQ